MPVLVALGSSWVTLVRAFANAYLYLCVRCIGEGIFGLVLGLDTRSREGVCGLGDLSVCAGRFERYFLCGHLGTRWRRPLLCCCCGRRGPERWEGARACALLR